MTAKVTFILGGARSGKSTYAEQLAQAGQQVLFIATAQAFDAEMTARIAAHRATRPGHWHTLEAPTAIATALQTIAFTPDIVVLDCVTLLVSNLLLAQPENAPFETSQTAIDAEISALIAAFSRWPAHWIIVSNEVGLGIVPAYPLGRTYRDLLGRVNQQLARRADSTVFMLAGLPMRLSPITD